MDEEQRTEVRREVAEDNGEVVERRTVRSSSTVPGTVFAQRLIYYIGGVLLALLTLRFLLLLFGASRNSGFVDFIYSFSGIFVAPFNGIFAEPTYGTARFDTSTLVAIIVYALITVGLANLMTLGSRNRT